jgi:hypothetical protein
MKWDRLVVFSIAAAFIGWANYVPTNFPEDKYGRGMPMKWTYDPRFTPSLRDDTAPIFREFTDEKQWTFSSTGLFVDIAVALLVLGIVMAINEVVQTSYGNRSPRVPPNDR